jgi:hypothetical protein
MSHTGPATFELVIGPLPANTPCIIHAWARGADEEVLYEAEAADVVFPPDVQTRVILNMVAADFGDHEGGAPRVIAVRRPGTPVQTGNIVAMEFVVGDTNDPVLSYSLASPVGGSFDAPAGQIVLTDGTGTLGVQYTAPDVAGPAPIIIRLEDAAGLATSFSFTLSIQEEPVDQDPTQAATVVNFPPVIDRIVASRMDDMIQLEAITSDDGPPADVTCHWLRQGTPIGTGNPVYLPATGDVVTITLTAVDGGGASSSLSFTLDTASTTLWHLSTENQPPVVLTAVQSQTDVSYGDTVELSLQVTDPDGDALTAEWSTTKGSLDGFASEVQDGITLVRARWHADVTAGVARVTAKISDPRQAWVAYVFPINQTLGRVNIVADAGPDQEALLGASATLDGSASTSEDGQISSYKWTKLSGPASTIEDDDAATTAVHFTTIGIYRYRLTVRNINNVATDDVEIAVTDPHAFMFEAAEMTNAGRVYFLNRTDRKVHRYDIPAGDFLPPWPTRTDVKTMAVAPEGDALYVGYAGGSIDVFDTGSGERSYFASSSDTALSMAVVGRYLFVIDRVAGSATYSTYDRSTGVRAATSSPGYYYGSQYLGVAQTLSRVFHFRDGVSPNDIHRVDINQATGQLSNIAESPYHGGYSFTPPIRFFPDETKVVVASGAIFSTADLTTAGSFGRSYVDMGFHGPFAHLVSKSGVRTEVNVYDTNLAVLAVSYYDGDPLRMFIYQDAFVLITKQAERIVGVRVLSLPLE